jgi:LPXTG-motif cell wall-anchored protein
VVPGVIIDDPEVPAGPGIPAASAAPQPSAPAAVSTPDPEVPIDDTVPLGGVDLEDDAIPQGTTATPEPGGKLPQTGESSPLPIYMAGLGMIVIGFVLSRIYRRKRN